MAYKQEEANVDGTQFAITNSGVSSNETTRVFLPYSIYIFPVAFSNKVGEQNPRVTIVPDTTAPTEEFIFGAKAYQTIFEDPTTITAQFVNLPPFLETLFEYEYTTTSQSATFS